jgi:DNA polymerase-3 subunit chi
VTRVDFYVLPDERPRGRELLACKLTEKAYRLGHRVFIHAASPQQAAECDELLWTFREGSFVPHALAGAGEEPAPPVCIAANEPAAEFDLLINLADEVPLFFSRFERVAEVVDAAPQTRELGRERFRFYKERGYPLDTHKL